MNKRYIQTTSLLLGSLLLFSGCSGDNSSFTAPEVSGTNDVQTQTADHDSFSIATEKRAVEGVNYEGNTSEITIYVADRNNNPVPDNTAVRFEASWGQVEPQCLTETGSCTVIWTEAGKTSEMPTTFEAIILAYTRGEESFVDSNDNDAYDAGETFTDISEPFFDINGNGTRESATEEFIDVNANNVFDTADGVFTGTPCIGDNTVCNRVNTFIWDTATVVLSASEANVSILSGSLPTTPSTTATLVISVTDTNGKVMADGTTVSLSADGTVDPTSLNLAAGQTQFVIRYTTGATSPATEILTIEVTAPSGLVTTTTFTTTI